MRFTIFFVFVFLLAGISGLIIFLNNTPIKLLLTPVLNETYYHLPVMPLGLLVVLSFVSGLIIGYILSKVKWL